MCQTGILLALMPYLCAQAFVQGAPQNASTKRASRQESQRYKPPRGAFGLPEPSEFFASPKPSQPQDKQVAAAPSLPLPVEIPLCDLFPDVFLVMTGTEIHIKIPPDRHIEISK